VTASTKTRPSRATMWREQVLSGAGCLQRGDWLCRSSLSSPAGRFTLTHRDDGELLLADSTGKPVWSVGSAGIPAGGLTLMLDGDLVLYDAGDWPVWSSGTAGQPVEWLLVTDDGNVVLLDGSCRMRWRAVG